MPQLIFFNSPHPLDSLLKDTVKLVDAVAEGVGCQSYEEYLVLTGLAMRILNGRIADTYWDEDQVGSLGLYAEEDDAARPYTYIELNLNTGSVALLPAGMLVRFD